MPRFRNLPLFWKLLVPFFTLMLIFGAFGLFIIVHDLSARAQSEIDKDLSRRALEARSSIRDRELYLLEAASFAANLEGMREAVRNTDDASATRLLRSVAALKPDLNLTVVTDKRGVGLVEYSRAGSGDRPSPGKGSPWARYDLVKRLLSAQGGAKHGGFITVRGSLMLAVAGPVCSNDAVCDPIGATIVAIDVSTVAAGAAALDQQRQAGFSIYDDSARTIFTSGLASAVAPAAASAGVVTARRGHIETATWFSPLQIQGRRAGTIAISVPTAPAFAAVRGTAYRLAAIVLFAMTAVVALGAVLSRSILAQVKPLVEMNRALGRGELSARAAVKSADELGELAQGVNQMAEQLQASYETLEQRVTERTEEVRRLLGERDEFFAGISHELRTPLAIIRAQMRLLHEPTYPRDRKSLQEAMNVIDGSTEQLLLLVNDVLELASGGSGRVQMQMEEFALPPILTTMEPKLRGLARAGDLKFRMVLPRKLPLVRADPGRLQAILVNLVDNAVKYTPAGGSITLDVTQSSGVVGFAITDTGVGIPPGVGDFVFEPFYRVEGVKTQRGEASSGLGLAVAKRFIEAQGGAISFAGNEHGGTTFTFTVQAVESGE